MKRDATVGFGGGRDTKTVEFVLQDALETSRAGCKESMFCAIHPLSLWYYWVAL